MKRLLFAITLLLATTSLFAQTAEEIMTNSLKAMNHEAFQKINTFKIVGSQFNKMIGQELTTTMYLKRPNMIRMEIEIMGMTITQAYNGKKGWSVNPLTGSESKEDIPEEAVPELLRMFEILASPLGEWGKEENKFEFAGTETIEEKSYNKVKIVSTKDDEVQEGILYIDALTNWFYKYTTTVPGEDDKMSVIEVIYQEKTKKKGIILPSVVEVVVDGETNSIIKFDEFELDLTIDDKIFEKL